MLQNTLIADTLDLTGRPSWCTGSSITPLDAFSQSLCCWRSQVLRLFLRHHNHGKITTRHRYCLWNHFLATSDLQSLVKALHKWPPTSPVHLNCCNPTNTRAPERAHRFPPPALSIQWHDQVGPRIGAHRLRRGQNGRPKACEDFGIPGRRCGSPIAWRHEGCPSNLELVAHGLGMAAGEQEEAIGALG